MVFRLHVAGLLILIGLMDKANAQASFLEGTLRFHIDTIRRLETQPAAYRATQFKLYKKGKLIRVEKLSINQFDSTDRQRTIEIRNEKGIYSWMESQSALMDFAIFSSYEEEKLMRSKAALQGQLKTYTAKKTGQKSVLLSMPTEKIVMTSLDKTDAIDVQVTKAIDAPVGLFFDFLHGIEGTPLEFTDSQYGWLNRYTIESVTFDPVPDKLFKVDPKLKVMTMEQMEKEMGAFK